MSRRGLTFAVIPAVLFLSACADDAAAPLAPRIIPGEPMASVVSLTGKMTFIDGSGLVVRDYGAGGADATIVPGASVVPDGPAMSPDLQRVVFYRGSGVLDIVDTDGANLRNLIPATTCPAPRRARWSPDGTRVLSAGCTSGVLVVDVASGAADTVPNTAGVTYAEWSSDGTKIFWSTTTSASNSLGIINVDGTGSQVLFHHASNYPIKTPRLSPDGSQIVLWANGFVAGSNVHEIWAMGADGSGAHLVRQGDVAIWTPDAQHILVRSSAGVVTIHPDGTDQQAFSAPGTPWDWRGPGAPVDNDTDDDGVIDSLDNCPNDPNADQLDTDADGAGNACDTDDDDDLALDTADNCPLVANADQADSDGDGIGNACDTDDDNDGVQDGADNCPATANATQTDTDGDGIGDACDPDDDGDAVADVTDNCPLTANPSQGDADQDGLGDACDTDNDNDGVQDATDNCPAVANPTQANADSDARGDACDADDDNDRLYDGVDDNPVVVGTHFTRGSTAGTLGVSPAGVTVTVDVGTTANAVVVTYARTSGSGAALVTIDLDNIIHNWQSDVQTCTGGGCAVQLTRTGSQLLVQPTNGTAVLSASLYGGPNLITVPAGGSATLTETVAAGSLTDATVAVGSTGTVVVNGLTIPNNTTTAIGKLAGKTALSGGKTKTLTVTGTLTQSLSSNGLDPLTEVVVLAVGGQTWTVNAGGFTAGNGGTYNYGATVGGVQLTIQLKKSKATEWTVKLTASPSSQATPTNIGLRVGNDIGTTTG